MSIVRTLAFIIIVALVGLAFPLNNSNASQLQLNIEVSQVVEQQLETEDEVEVIVSLKNFSSQDLNYSKNRNRKKSEENQILSDIGESKAVAQYSHIPAVALKVNKKQLQKLKQDSRIAGISENKTFTQSKTRPNLNNAINSLNAEAAWDLPEGLTGQGQTIVIIDNGVDTSHPFIGDAVVHERCHNPSSKCRNNASEQFGPGSAAPYGGRSHGTHVTGIAAGRQGVGANPKSGIAPEVDIVAINIFNSEKDETDSASILSALDWVASNHTNIAAVNLSLGSNVVFNGYCDKEDYNISSVINFLRNVNVATVVSSGNHSAKSGMSLPACIRNAVAVGATSSTSDTVASISNSSAALDLLAPGVSIRSSIYGGNYGLMTGTSMSAPMIAAAFAILRQAHPSESVDQLLYRLQTSGTKITDNGIRRTKPNLKQAVELSLPSSLTAPEHVEIVQNAGNATIAWPEVADAVKYEIVNRYGSLIKTVDNSQTATNVTTQYNSQNRFGVRAVTAIGKSSVTYSDFTTGTLGPQHDGYAFFASNGAVIGRGAYANYSRGALPGLNRPVVGGATSSNFDGGWSVAADGGIFTFGNAQFYGSTGSMRLNKPIVGMASTASGKGYWLVASDGGIFSFGDARFYGSTGSWTLNQPIVGMKPSVSGKGYWLFASDGGVFSFGNTKFYGSGVGYNLFYPRAG